MLNAIALTARAQLAFVPSQVQWMVNTLRNVIIHTIIHISRPTILLHCVPIML